MCGESWRLAHQTTAASATSDTSAWMIAKRQFMARDAARRTVADRSSCTYPQTGVSIRRYPPTLAQTDLLASIAVAAFCPLPAYAQGGGEAPPGGTQTPPPVAPSCASSGPAAADPRGQVNRELLGGTWYFRQDDAFVGEQERWFDQDDLTGWSYGHGPAQLERHGHHREQGLGRLVPQGLHAAALAEEGAPLLEGPLRGQQLPHEGLAERQGARGWPPATSRSRCCCPTCAGATTRSSSRSRRCAATPTSPTGGPRRSTASARAAGGTSAASCARCTSGAWTRWTWST